MGLDLLHSATNINLSHPSSSHIQKTMTSLSQSLVFTRDPQFPSFPGSPFKHLEQSPVNCSPTNLSLHPIRQRKAKLSTRGSSVIVRAGYSGDGGRSAGIFVGGFVLGGVVVGALGCIYAPQISKALAGADRKDLMRKLPKFIYDEEKALEKTRKILTEKIAQLNSAIDDVSSQLRANDVSNGAAVVTDEVETPI